MADMLNNTFEDHTMRETPVLTIETLSNGTIIANAAGFESIIDQLYRSFKQTDSFVPVWIKAFLVAFGIVTNSINVVVFTRPSMPPSSINVLIVGLESVNLIVYATFFNEIARHCSKTYNVSYFGCIASILTLCVEVSIVCASNWLTVAIGAWRLLVISDPLRVEQRCSQFRAKLTLTLVCVCAVPFGILHALLFSSSSLEINIVKNNMVLRTEYVHTYRESTLLAENPTLLTVSTALILLTTTVPCTVLSVITVALLHYLWKARNERKAMLCVSRDKYDVMSRETRITVTLLCMLFLLLFAILPDSIANVMYFFVTYSDILETNFVNLAFSRILILVSNASTFFFYCFMSEKFRHTLRHLLRFDFGRSNSVVTVSTSVQRPSKDLGSDTVENTKL